MKNLNDLVNVIQEELEKKSEEWIKIFDKKVYHVVQLIQSQKCTKILIH